MKQTRSLHRKGASAATFLVAVSITYMSMLPQAEADVIWLASDDGTDLTLTTDGGSIDLTGAGDISGTSGVIENTFRHDSVTVLRNGSPAYAASSLGIPSGLDPWVAPTAIVTGGAGSTYSFGLSGGAGIFWDSSEGNFPGTITPLAFMVFPGLTVADAFGTNLNAGPVLLWTGNNPGSKMFVGLSAVPEPSSAVFVTLGFAVTLLYRRRKLLPPLNLSSREYK